MDIKRVLVICVGNICRSPMAEALLKVKLAESKDIVIESAGIGALVNHPADKYAQQLMRDRKIDISAHKARQINGSLVQNADIILVMEQGHKHAITDMFPTSRAKIFRLGEFSGKDIDDPYKKSLSAFEESLKSIESGVADWSLRISGAVT
jgi:protein-tyrosine phosphatase